MSTSAADCYDEIWANVNRIRQDEQPRCPLAPSKPLYICLREVAQCGPACPLRGDWIGPQEIVR